MNKYNEYIDVGLPWYPHGIPSHWSLVRHKNVLTEHKELVGENSANYTLLSLTLNGVIIRDISEGKGKFAKDYDKYVVVDEGDFVFCLFDVEETPRTVGLSKHHGMITGAYDVFKPHDINPEYFYYYYLALDNVKALKPLYSGLRKVIPYPSFMAMKVPVPPKDEQDQIVRYLDWKVSNINRLIHGYQRQIKLLEERKRTLVDNAVTKGLNPNAETKDSGIYWLGRIPAGWEIKKLGAMFKQRNEKVSDKEYSPLSVGYMGVVPQLENAAKTDNGDNRKLICQGDFAVNSRSDRKGACGLSKYTGSASLIITVYQPQISIHSEYFHYLFRSHSYTEEFYRNGHGLVSDLWTTNWHDMKSILLPYPPITEQIEIAKHIESETAKIDLLKEKVSKQIESLKEYRTRLISDVVTGQVDVRGVEIPDYTPEEDNAVDEETNDDMEEVTDSAD